MSWKPGEELKVTKNARLVMPYIRQAVQAGIGANETQRLLRAAGMGVQRASILDIHKAYTYAYTNPGVYVPNDVRLRPNADLIPLAVEEQNKTWRTTMWYDVYNEEDGVIRHHITIDSDNLLTLDEYYQYTGQYGNKYGFDGNELLDIGFASITFSDAPRNRL